LLGAEVQGVSLDGENGGSGQPAGYPQSGFGQSGFGQSGFGQSGGRHARRAARILGGRGTRLALLVASLLAGLVIALLTVHLAGAWEGRVWGPLHRSRS
jgi:hypothetical protein